MSTPQATEYLYEWRNGDEGGQTPDRWVAQRILKRTKKFVFVEYKVSERHPYRQTMKLDRAELEANGKIYWSHGTWCVPFYTEKAKADVDQAYFDAIHTYIPEFLKALGLTANARKTDVKRAYHELALKLHPDKGGSHEEFLKLQENYERAMEAVPS
jgi:Tfp pilus assembly protein PilF